MNIKFLFEIMPANVSYIKIIFWNIIFFKSTAIIFLIIEIYKIIFIKITASDWKSDGYIFNQKTDPMAKTETKFFQISIRFNLIRQYASLIRLKRIKSNAIFDFFVKSDRIHFYFLSDRKKKLFSIWFNDHFDFYKTIDNYQTHIVKFVLIFIK